MRKKFTTFMTYTFVPAAVLFAVRHSINGEAWYAAGWAFVAGAGFYDWLEQIATRYHVWRTK
jgi:hypothetical protein